MRKILLMLFLCLIVSAACAEYSGHDLMYRSGDTDRVVQLYTTAEEVGTSSLAMQVEGATLYARLDTATGPYYTDTVADRTMLRAQKSNMMLSALPFAAYENYPITAPATAAYYLCDRIAIDNTGGYAYIYDGGLYRVCKFALADFSPATYWGAYGTDTYQFKGNNSNGMGIAVNTDGDRVYVADGGNDRVSIFDNTGSFVASWSCASGGVAFVPRGICYSSYDDTLWLVASATVRQCSTDGTILQTFGSYGTGNGQLTAARGIRASPAGDYVYVMDGGNNRITKYTYTGTYTTRWGANADTDGNFRSPLDLALSPDGSKVYGLSQGNSNHSIQAFSNTGTFLWRHGTVASAANNYYSTPRGVEVASSTGDIYIADTSNGRIQKLASDGSWLDEYCRYAPQSEQAFAKAIGEKDAWLAYATGQRFAVYSSAGTLLRCIGRRGTDIASGEMLNIVDFCTDRTATDTFWAVDASLHTVYNFDLDSGELLDYWGTYGTGDGQLCGALSITTDINGNIFIGQASSGASLANIQKFDADGTYVAKYGTYGTGDNQFSAPSSIVTDADGAYLYVYDKTNQSASKIDLSTGGFEWQVSPDVSALSTTGTIALDATNKRVYVTDWSNQRLAVLDPADGTTLGYIPWHPIKSGVVSLYLGSDGYLRGLNKSGSNVDLGLYKIR